MQHAQNARMQYLRYSVVVHPLQHAVHPVTQGLAALFMWVTHTGVCEGINRLQWAARMRVYSAVATPTQFVGVKIPTPITVQRDVAMVLQLPPLLMYRIRP